MIDGEAEVKHHLQPARRLLSPRRWNIDPSVEWSTTIQASWGNADDIHSPSASELDGLADVDIAIPRSNGRPEPGFGIALVMSFEVRKARSTRAEITARRGRGVSAPVAGELHSCLLQLRGPGGGPKSSPKSEAANAPARSVSGAFAAKFWHARRDQAPRPFCVPVVGSIDAADGSRNSRARWRLELSFLASRRFDSSCRLNGHIAGLS